MGGYLKSAKQLQSKKRSKEIIIRKPVTIKVQPKGVEPLTF